MTLHELVTAGKLAKFGAAGMSGISVASTCRSSSGQSTLVLIRRYQQESGGVEIAMTWHDPEARSEKNSTIIQRYREGP